jgi:hypothetical protein
MIRGIVLILGLALITLGVALSWARLHVDGLSALAIVGLVLVILTHRRPHPTP